MSEEWLKTEMRLSAIEYLLCELSAKIYMANSGGDLSKLDDWQQGIMSSAKQRTFPALPPADSDMFSAEFEEALGTLLKAQREVAASLVRK